MSEFIITKYAEYYYPSGRAPREASVGDTYSAKEVGVEKQSYASCEEARADLKKLNEFNPAVGYGIVEVDEGRGSKDE